MGSSLALSWREHGGQRRFDSLRISTISAAGGGLLGPSAGASSIGMLIRSGCKSRSKRYTIGCGPQSCCGRGKAKCVVTHKRHPQGNSLADVSKSIHQWRFPLEHSKRGECMYQLAIFLAAASHNAT